MRDSRSASQILFGFLPDQTIDAHGGVWRVTRWRRPVKERMVDVRALRDELVRQAGPWAVANRDGGFVEDLRRGHPVQVYSLDRENGVEAEPFPRLWECRKCHRLRADPAATCYCGAQSFPGQFHFVGYCSDCGALREPYVPKCRAHDERRVLWPGTASAREIRFDCPVCGTILKEGLGMPPCGCGTGHLTFAVHRAASVYSPRSVVIVNPPSLERIRPITDAGGPPRALAWVVNGMVTKSVADAPSTREAVRESLRSTGLGEEQIELMLAHMETPGGEDVVAEVDLLDRADAEAQAVSIALATTGSRRTIDDLLSAASGGSELAELYGSRYRHALSRAGLAAVELIDRFPVLTGMFGYTRGGPDPASSRLVAFRRENQYAVYADLAQTEALFLRLDPFVVAEWLRGRGFEVGLAESPNFQRYEILRAATGSGNEGLRDALFALVHSYCHRLIRLAAVFGGIDRNALAELVVPLHLGFFVYAASRGDFVLGGLQATFETELDQLLTEMAEDEHHCPLDPGCREGGGACMACLHLGEPSCRHFNTGLSRSVLAGARGYLVVCQR